MSIKDNTKRAPAGWHAPTQDAEHHDRVLDIPEVLRRYNSAYQTSIRVRPIDAVLRNKITWKELNKRIYDNAFDPKTGTYREVQQNLRLPGFSSLEEMKVGD